MKLKLREVIIFGMLGGLMHITKFLMASLPNVHLVAVFIISTTVVYRVKALFPLYIYVLLEGACSEAATLEFWFGGNNDRVNDYPNYYYDDSGNLKSIDTEKTIEINIADTHIYTIPYDKKKRLQAIKNLRREDLDRNKNELIAYYYPDVNAAFVAEGRHHIHAADYYNRGTLICKLFDDTLLYENVYTNGRIWHHRNPSSDVVPVKDFRLAAVYSLARRRHLFKKRVESKQRNACLTE